MKYMSENPRLKKLKEAVESAGVFVREKIVKPVGKFLQEGTDRPSVRGFRTTYQDVATDEEIQQFREAEEENDNKTMDKLRKILDERKKYERKDAVQQAN